MGIVGRRSGKLLRSAALLWGGLWSGLSAQSSTATNSVVRTLRGQVVSATDGNGIPRTLVTVNSRAVLTDSQGRFIIPEFSDATAYATLTRPGYSASADGSPMSGRRRIPDLDANIELKMYPDATILGTVTDRSGLPISGANVMLRRLVSDPGGPRWQTVKSSRTTRRGEYRFREPAGRFRLSVGFVAGDQETGEDVLPVQFPDGTSTGDGSYLELQPGEQRQVDLRPRTGIAVNIPLRVDADKSQRGVQFLVSAGGGIFNAPVRSAGTPGRWMLSLPTGSYTVAARVMGERNVMLTGSARVTVTGRQPDAVTIHLEPVASLPIEIALDPASITAAATSNGAPGIGTPTTSQPDPRQWNLHLHNVDSRDEMEQDIFPQQREDKTFEFRAPPGRYRLTASMAGGAWYVETASYGLSNLTTSDIVVSSGAAQTPIRIVAGNSFGNVNGTVKISAEVTDIAWVYLIPETPSVPLVNPLGVGAQGGAIGTFGMRLPAGKYYAVAYDHWIRGDLHDPETLARVAAQAKEVEVTAGSGAPATVELEILQEKEGSE